VSQDFEHIVIGAGISGLGMAHQAVRREISTLVLEGEDRVGGCLHSRTFPGCGGFWTEAGGHTCFNSYGYLLAILTDLGLMGRLIGKEKLSYLLWRNGERRSIFSALHIPELIRSLPRLFTSPKAGKCVAEFYGPGLGRRNYRDLFRPAFRAVVCQEVDDFPADLLFRCQPKQKGVMRRFTFPGGLGEIPQAIAGQDALDVRTGQRVSGVVRTDQGYQVRLAGGSRIGSRYLTLAVPPDVAATLVPEGLEDLRGLIGSIGVTAIETWVVCVSAAVLGHWPPLAGLIAIDDAFYSVVSRDYLPDGHYRGFAFHFRPQGPDAQARMARICQVLGIAEEQIAGVFQVSNRLPVLRAGHPKLVQKIDTLLAGGRLAITGNWFLGVSIEDCLTRSHQECERLFSD